MENLARFPNCILLTRVGQFYESYFDQAPEVARLLGIKLASRNWGGSRVHMCGFPLAHLDRHLKVLVAQGKRFVALCEEFRRVDGFFDRRVVRIVTPGTLIDESFLNQFENNYLLSISPIGPSTEVGLAWIDVSTGEFFSQSTTLDSLRDDLVRIGPREVVLHKSMEGQPEHPLHQALGEESAAAITYVEPNSTRSPTTSPAEDAYRPQDLSVPPVYTEQETSAVQLLTTFLQSHLLELMPELASPTRESRDIRMQIDSHTLPMREGGVTGSLLSTIKRTVTSGGTRLLARWLCSPSTSVSEINARQSLVALLRDHPHLRADLADMLKGIEDVTRIVQKFLFNKGDVEDLAAIKDTIEMWMLIKGRISIEGQQHAVEDAKKDPDWNSLFSLITRMHDLHNLAQRIGMAVDGNELKKREATSTGVEEGQATDDKLQRLHDRRKELLVTRSHLESHLQEQYAAPSLTLRATGPHGLHVHIGRAKRDNQLIENSSKAIVVGQSNTTKSYFHQDWAVLGSQIVETENALFLEERRAFDTLRNEVNADAGALRRNARILDELDVALGFANLAADMNFVRPTLNDSTSYHVVNGRHPTVELGLLDQGRVFTPNTVLINETSRLHIITGPNMSGKSSLLRQTALIAILAQVGSFVPADHAELGLVDKVFSRVGAKDDLYRDRSTFMVEMLETAEILRRATHRSLVIMDEVGRGTTVKDGMAIAFATVHHLYHINKCRALFATHFHEVADMLGYSETTKGAKSDSFRNIGFFCTGLDELEDGRFAYSHRLKPGVNRDSHGLKVAQLAGMPPSVVQLASTALDWMNMRGGHWISNRDDLRALGQDLSLSPPSSSSSSSSPRQTS
ncbi:hypothetical protein BS47DRAFT_1372653 [Hydnum rufescens UP504]|uniref:DNA mismatch repair proteins mutS family domain-containing protein n=1 Tax=Hydnum rufescens UP504 TaxID=1448309 RepID=A0A9P6DTC0_9AGAM|nr:hypothetical protein BS47DRAFT_1372653 [Hydnum rufescens UP504]